MTNIFFFDILLVLPDNGLCRTDHIDHTGGQSGGHNLIKSEGGPGIYLVFPDDTDKEARFGNHCPALSGSLNHTPHPLIPQQAYFQVECQEGIQKNRRQQEYIKWENLKRGSSVSSFSEVYIVRSKHLSVNQQRFSKTTNFFLLLFDFVNREEKQEHTVSGKVGAQCGGVGTVSSLFNVTSSVLKQLPYCILIFNKSRLNNDQYCNSYPFIHCQSNPFLPIKAWLNCPDVCCFLIH